jgi:hypothetical protein
MSTATLGKSDKCVVAGVSEDPGIALGPRFAAGWMPRLL